MRVHAPIGRVLGVGALSLVLFGVGALTREGIGQAVETDPPRLARLTQQLSERGGYFDTDNLVSNERSYVQVIDRLEPRGGAYVGVGPEQNYNYIGRLRPEWAFVVDLRPDNRLHQLLLIAVLAQSESPYEYLCRLFSRAPDGSAQEGAPPSVDALIARFERSTSSEAIFEGYLADTERYLSDLGIDLSESDREQLRSIYGAFYRDQLDIRFRSHGRPSMSHYPSYRTLLRARTPEGVSGHFLSRPEDYRHLRELARSERLVPVVGDFGGEKALVGVGRFLSERNLTLSAFYTSNVEYYLFGSERYRQFVENVRALPTDDESLFIRACFDYGWAHPQRLPGHRSTMLLQRVERFLALWDSGSYRSYWEICTQDYLGRSSVSVDASRW